MTARRPVNLPPPIDWASLPVHPEAARLPMMSDAELKELAADIKAHGMQEPLIVWRDNTEEANGGKEPFPRYLLDGRNRLAALKLIGIDNPNFAPKGGISWSKVHTLDAVKMVVTGVNPRNSKRIWKPHVDPASLVRSLNVHRRHLTAEQKRQAIADHIKLDPTASDRKIGRKVGVDHKTATKVRDDLEARGEVPHVSKRTDSAGRKQPARKPTRKPKPKPADEPKPQRETTKLTIAPESEPGLTTRTEITVSGGPAVDLHGHRTPQPEPVVEDVEPDIDALITDIAAGLAVVADYVCNQGPEGRRRVFFGHKDAINAARKSLQVVINNLNAVDKTDDPRWKSG